MKLQDFDFRIWDSNKKCYLGRNSIGVSLHLVKRDNEIRVSYPFHEEGQEPPQAKDCEIELYTGFKDKNGNKIFEGDILEYELCLEKISLNEKCCARVVFESGCFKCVTSIKNKFDLNTFAEIDKVKGFDKLEVIGNIHENKDLLK